MYRVVVLFVGIGVLGAISPGAPAGPPSKVEHRETVLDRKIHLEDGLRAKTGNIEARIARWYDNNDAAISLRFDDSHPSHINIAVPLLTQYGMVGTFFINPGRDAYKKHRRKWETEAVQGGHEFANHTMHHRGAKNDQEADSEIGECSRYIWKLFPKKSKLLAFRSGGGTTWHIEKPWSHYRQKWHLISAPYSGAVGTDGPYSKITSLEAFKKRTEETIANREWFSFYFHAIGTARGMGIAEKLFRDMMRYLRTKRRRVWFGGVAQIHKYQTERDAAKILAELVEPHKLKIDVGCNANPELYDQPLTIELVLPKSLPPDRVTVKDAKGKALATRQAPGCDRPTVRFDVPPVDANYLVEKTRDAESGAIR